MKWDHYSFIWTRDIEESNDHTISYSEFSYKPLCPLLVFSNLLWNGLYGLVRNCGWVNTVMSPNRHVVINKGKVCGKSKVFYFLPIFAHCSDRESRRPATKDNSVEELHCACQLCIINVICFYLTLYIKFGEKSIHIGTFNFFFEFIGLFSQFHSFTSSSSSLLLSALQLISYILYKNHICESGAFSGERVRT